ncbi:MAG: hypothetical protein IKJ35_06485 [Clostridia bacterium]|nr:hypothetical protein [Clostridia bacterium]
MNPKLAEIAREEARKNYHGDTVAAIGNLHPIAELFEIADDVTEESLLGDWSGAFVFLCTERADVGLPVRYPDPRVGTSFAYVDAWERYAKLPKIRLWLPPEESPEIGDIVLLEPTAKGVPQMGIILSLDGDQLEIAMGNYHNHSAIVERARDDRVKGYIRLPEIDV